MNVVATPVEVIEAISAVIVIDSDKGAYTGGVGVAVGVRVPVKVGVGV